MGGRAFSYQDALLCNQLPVWVHGADTLSLVDLKLYFLTKLAVGSGVSASRDAESGSLSLIHPGQIASLLRG